MNTSRAAVPASWPHRLAVLGICLCLGVGCLHGPAPHQRAELAGTLWWMTPDDIARSAKAWHAELDPIQDLGMHIMILNGDLGVSETAAGPDPIEVFLSEADRRGLSLYLDTLAAPDWWTLTDAGPEIARAGARAELLERRYGTHRSFAGFYIPYELYTFWGPQAELIRALYRDISAACKRAAPGKAVMISPFFILDRQGYLGNFRYASPVEYEAFWTETLRGTHVDIVALQDSGEHLSCYTLDERRPFLGAMKAACAATGKQFWVNVELGELEVASLDDYAARFGRKTHVNDSKTQSYWRGVPAAKLIEKLKLAGEYSSTAISWGYREFIRPSLSPTAQNLYTEYRAALHPRD